MPKQVSHAELISHGLAADQAQHITQQINAALAELPPAEAWQRIVKTIFSPATPFALQLFLFSIIFPDWEDQPDTACVCLPDPYVVAESHVQQCMHEQGFGSVADFHLWTVMQTEAFWHCMLLKLGIVFHQKPTQICQLGATPEQTQWLPGARLNITESCFTAPDTQVALIFPGPNGLQTMSYGALNQLSNRVANSLVAQGLKTGDAIAIDMPMTPNAIAIYLGIIKMGGVVVGIADSFAAEEIALRLQIAQAKAIFTQDVIFHGEKILPLYAKVKAANCPLTIVITAGKNLSVTLDAADLAWENFLVATEQFSPVVCGPMQACNILFSSGTTGTPKAIPWNHTTPLKAASDAYLQQNIQPRDVLAWPTSLGWMMGPWLIFAAFINRASIALFPAPPQGREFGDFVQAAKVTMLGVVPTLVAAWRQSDCMRGVDWSSIKVFTSTGEASRALDMFYLMSLAGFPPIIEYCGGTEIGGSYVSSTVVQKNYLTLFSTPAFGSNFILLDAEGRPSHSGEVALIPPALGLSTELLNADHHAVYFANMPSVGEQLLRRHGDALSRLPNGYYCVLGRADDTMNLGGIKISAIEIERALSGIPDIQETAAVAVTPQQGGPSQLVIFATTRNTALTPAVTQTAMQERINQHLNPLFKIHAVIFVAELPKTPSNKIMRRMLRESLNR